MLNTIIKDITSRLGALEQEFKNLKWLTEEALKLFEANQLLVDCLSARIDKLYEEQEVKPTISCEALSQPIKRFKLSKKIING
jgi:hypothetical protein